METGCAQLDRERDVSQGMKNNSIVALLQSIQERYNYLPEEVLRELVRGKNISLMDIYSVATFYKSFSLVPRGKHEVLTCSGTACHVRGSDKVTAEISRILNVKPGHTSEDGEYSLETVNCLGACALAPLVVIDDQYYGNMTPTKILNILNGKLKEEVVGEKGKDGSCQCVEAVASARTKGLSK